MPTPAPTDAPPASIPCPDLAAALGVEDDADATPAELLDAVREMVARDAAQRAQIAALGAERDAARQEASTLAANLNETTRRANDLDRDLRARQLGWHDHPVATALTRADLEARIALWTQAAEVEATAGDLAMQPLFSLLSAKEAETVRAMRLQAAEDLRAMALAGVTRG